MSELIRIENLSKRYRLGVINRGMLYKDLQSWWARKCGKEDPNEVIRENHPSVDRLRKRRDFWALRDINFSIYAGDTIGVIGRNGAGKSTLLKILSRTTSPTKGRVLTRGRISSLLEVGTGFHPELTGRENVFLNGAILGMTTREVRSKFDEIVAFAEIDEFIDTPVKRYSSGMYVRLAFAVAAHLDPEVLIVDEVLAVGDASFQRKCIGKMSKVAKDGRTVILVSHSMVLIETLTRRCIWLQDGRMQLAGESKHVASEYLKSAQEQQLGSSAGLHDHRLRRGSGEVRLEDVNTTDEAGEKCLKFRRGQRMRFTFTIKAFRPCRELALSMGFKLGLSGEMLLCTARHAVSKNSLAPGDTFTVTLDVDSDGLPAALYDLYIWLGPIKEEVLNEYYDIADGLVPPIQVFEGDSLRSSLTELSSRIAISSH
jgi:lipopolysaccharide transport system ATP-binding protein